MRIPFVGPSYTTRSLNVDCERTLNAYLEMDNNSPRAPLALYGRPGMLNLGVIGNGPIRGMLEEGGYMFVVSANEVYKVSYSGGFYSATFIGNVGTSTGAIGMTSNGTQILIIDGTGGWLASPSTIVLTAISDPDFPTGVTRCTFQDGYFLVTGDGSGKFYINESPNDGLSWDGTDFASAEGSPDNTIGIISDHREVWLFGDRSTEVWINTGNADFPFERSGNTFIETGCSSADTVAQLDNTIYWLGRNAQGGGTVWKAQGYTPVRVSNHAVEKAIQGYTTITDSRAFSFQMEGHAFYVLSFPTADKTWVFDVSTGQWFEWGSMDSFGIDHMWRAACHVFFNNEHLVGDYVNGTFYRLDLNYNLDGASAAIRRLRATQCLDSEDGSRLFYEDMQVDMETGVGGTLLMRYSNDGGHTWSGYKSKSMGTLGSYGARVKFGPTGAGRNRVWEISTVTDSKWAILGGFSRFTKGDS